MGSLLKTLLAALGFQRYFILGRATVVGAVLAAGYASLSRQPSMAWLPTAPDWAFFIIALFAILFATTLFYANGLRRQLDPKVELSFEPRAPYIDRVEDSNIPLSSDPSNKAPSIWYSVRVTNPNQGTIAKACRAALTNIELLDGARYVPTRFSATQPLRWGLRHGGYNPIDIPHGETHYVNVISVDPVHKKILPNWEPPGWLAYEDLFEQHGTYRLTVVVNPSEGSGDIMRLIVLWNGDWENVVMEEDTTQNQRPTS